MTDVAVSRVARVQRHLATSAAASAVASAPRTPWQYGGPGHEELYEFGQREWCEAAAALGVQMLQRASADLAAAGVTAWALSEEYCQAPARLRDACDDGRPVFWIMISSAVANPLTVVVSGGASVRDAGFAAARRTRGFHTVSQWAKGCHYAGMRHGSDGAAARNADFGRLNDALVVACRPEPPAFLARARAAQAGIRGGKAFPRAAGKALRGLHNALARITRPSHEVLSFPRTAIGVPNLEAMDEAQSQAFFHLLQRPLRPVLGGSLRHVAKGGGGTFLGNLERAQAGEHEFGDLAWCKACAEYGARLLGSAAAAGDLDLGSHEWGFSEEYTEAPARCLGGRRAAGYWIAVSGGEVSCGWEAPVPSGVLHLSGFHIVAAWAAIAGPSGAIYGAAGSALRNHHFAVLLQQLRAAGKLRPPQHTIGGCFGRPEDTHRWAVEGYLPPPAESPSFPPQISAALRDRPGGGAAGLHNFAAFVGGRPVPELEGLPLTTSFCVDLARCTEAQKQQFFAALGRNVGHPENAPSQYS